MKGLEEIAIIHSVEDYPVGLFLKENLKLQGFSYFVYAYNQLNDKPNDILAKSANQFDLILYVNDQENNWQSRFSHLSNHNLNVELSDEEIWESPGKLDNNKLREIWEQILEEMYAGSPDLDKCINIMNVISDVYCEYDLFRKLLNNTESWFRQVRNETTEDIYEKSLDHQKNVWRDALKRLEQFSDDIGSGKVLQGEEHLDYAILYCKRKINDICDLLGREFEYDSCCLLSDANDVLKKYKNNFYMIENIIAKNARKSWENKGLAILSMKSCTLNCTVPACNSFHFYRLGKLYERSDKTIQSEEAYEKAYQLNSLNFRALYKIAISSLNQKYYDIARNELERILTILQIPIGNLYDVAEAVKKLPALELEYVCKCYFLLSEIEKKEEHMDCQYYNACKKIIDTIIEMIADNQNSFIKALYSDQPKYRNYLKKRLSFNAIREKVKIH